MTVAKVFISYRRIPSAMLATLLNEKLKVQGIDAYVDTRRTDGGGPFPNRLLRAIEGSDVFICLLADTTLDSDWVRREIEHAYSQAKPMIPVFQESYIPLATPTTSSISTLLQSDGIHVLDVKNLYVDQAVADLARMIKLTLGIEVSHAGDTTEIGERTYNLRPTQPASRRWPWIIAAALIVVLGILLFMSVNRDIINAAVAATQTAIAVAPATKYAETRTAIEIANATTGALLNQTETQAFFARQTATLFNPFTPTPSLTPTDTPTSTETLAPTCTPSPPLPTLHIGIMGGVLRETPSSDGPLIVSVSQVDLPIFGVSADSEYLLVDYNGLRGWIKPIFGEVQGNISSVPVVHALLHIGIMGGVLRETPSADGPLIVSVSEVELHILGVSRDGQYFLVDYDGMRGWINPTFGEVQGDISQVPVVENVNPC